jgi:hypothetical protein
VQYLFYHTHKNYIWLIKLTILKYCLLKFIMGWHWGHSADPPAFSPLSHFICPSNFNLLNARKHQLSSGLQQCKQEARGSSQGREWEENGMHIVYSNTQAYKCCSRVPAAPEHPWMLTLVQISQAMSSGPCCMTSLLGSLQQLSVTETYYGSTADTW